jgi:N-acetylglutamate synthase-like GNAT family acetyltransferase
MAADILCDEWKCSVDTRIRKMKEDNQDKCWILTDSERSCIYGYGELDASASLSKSDCVANGILTSLIICRSMRGRGLGSVALALFEDMARGRGYGYIYLWTTTAVEFYRKYGYHPCDPINGNKSVLKSLNDVSVLKIESLLRTKMPQVSRDMDPEESHSEKDIWLRKRIMTEVAAFADMDWNMFEQLISDSIQDDYRGISAYCYKRVPWCRQIGPSCGLAALVMCISHFHNLGLYPENSDSILENVLSKANGCGYTNDGEMFRISELASLCETVTSSQLLGEVVSTKLLTAKYVIDLLSRNFLIIIPYDRDDIGSLPCRKRGGKAHYAIIVGIVAEDFPIDSLSASFQAGKKEHMQDLGYVDENTKCSLIAVHSLSTRPVVASISDWIQSNQQLHCEKSSYSNEYMKTENPELCSFMLVLSSQS